MYYIFLLMIFLCHADANSFKFFAKIDTFNNNSLLRIKAYEESVATFNGSVLYSVFDESLISQTFIFKCWTGYEKVGIVKNWTDKILPPPTTNNVTFDFDVVLLARRLGGSKVICSIGTKDNSTQFYEQDVAEFIVNRHQTIAELIFRIVVSIFVIFLTFVMGCGLDSKIILEYLKRPVSPCIGFVSQFLFMPLISAILGKFSGIDRAFGLGLLVIGCSPGGGASNIWTVLFGGDLNLSMTMTFISSCAALALMPFWLFVLGRLFINPEDVKIPYDNIAINLLQVVIPAGLGMVFRWKWFESSQNLLKKVKLMGLIFIIFVFTFGTYANLYIYKLIGDYIFLLPIGAFLPWLGFILGFILAIIARRNKSQCIAIALETGFQNIGIAILILKFSMSQPDGDLGAVMPIVVAIFTPFPLYIGYLVLIIKKKCFSPKKEVNVKMEPHADSQRGVLLNELPA